MSWPFPVLPSLCAPERGQVPCKVKPLPRRRLLVKGSSFHTRVVTRTGPGEPRLECHVMVSLECHVMVSFCKTSRPSWVRELWGTVIFRRKPWILFIFLPAVRTKGQLHGAFKTSLMLLKVNNSLWIVSDRCCRPFRSDFPSVKVRWASCHTSCSVRIVNSSFLCSFHALAAGGPCLTQLYLNLYKLCDEA